MDESITTALRTIIDPDVGINIVDLGLVERIDHEAVPARVELILTSPACPQAGYIAEQCDEVLVALGIRAEVVILDDPPWNPERMSESARAALGWNA